MARRIHLLYLVDFLRTVNAGTERQLSHLLSYLPQIGYTVSLISLQNSDFLSQEAPVLFPGVRFHSFETDSAAFRNPVSWCRLFQQIRHHRPDLVHTFFPTSNSLGAIIARLSGVRHIVTSRRDMGYDLSGRDILKLKFAYPVVSAIIANSHAVGENTIQMEKCRPNIVHVIHNGLDLHDGDLGGKSVNADGPIVGIVANLNRRVKRVDLFILAAYITRHSIPDIRFWIIGDGELRSELERYTSELNMKSYIKFWGRRTDASALMQRFYLGVLCSDSEGLANAVMEYMAAGIPVVATDVGGNSELVTHGRTGLLTPPGDPTALAEGIMTLISNRHRARVMGAAGHRAISGRFSVETLVEKTTALYEDLLNSG